MYSTECLLVCVLWPCQYTPACKLDLHTYLFLYPACWQMAKHSIVFEPVHPCMCVHNIWEPVVRNWCNLVRICAVVPPRSGVICWILTLSYSYSFLAAAYMLTASVLQMLLFVSNKFSWHLWTDLYKTLTYNVYRSAVEHCEALLWYRPPPKKNWDSKTTYFWQLRNSVATLSANISGVELDRDNREAVLETTKGPLHHPKISWTWCTKG